jgi:hypothetical protein
LPAFPRGGPPDAEDAQTGPDRAGGIVLVVHHVMEGGSSFTGTHELYATGTGMKVDAAE